MGDDRALTTATTRVEDADAVWSRPFVGVVDNRTHGGRLEEREHVVGEVGRSPGGRGEALTPLHARRRSSDQLVAGLPGRSPIRKPL